MALLLTTALGACVVPETRTTTEIDPPVDGGFRSERASSGTVDRIERTDTRVGNSGAGAVTGGVLGEVVGAGLGRGFIRPLVAIAGAVGGAVLGNRVERSEDASASSRTYKVWVDLDDGDEREFDVASLDGLHSGERVWIEHGMLEPK